MNNAIHAAECWSKRQSRNEHPAGKFDKTGRWFPSAAERQECCKFIRYPSRAFPYSNLTHCRSKEHVANLFGVSVRMINLVLFLQKRDLLQEEIVNAVVIAGRCQVELSNQRILTMARKNVKAPTGQEEEAFNG